MADSEEKVEQGKEEVVTSSPTEELATAQGWKPKDQFVAEGGNESDWRPAKEFVDRGELFHKIEEIKRENRNLKKTMSEFREHHEKVAQIEYKRALETLQRQKKEALIDGDADKVVEIDEQILETRDAQKAASMAESYKEEQAPPVNPVFLAWQDRNSWYRNDSEMKSTADQVGIAYKQAHPDADPTVVLKYVEGRIKKVYPEKFVNPRKEEAPQVEGGSSPRKSRGETIELSDEEQRAMHRFVKAGAMTEEQYIAEIKTMRGVK